MPIEKSKPVQDPKSEKDKKIAKSSDELSDDDLRSVSGGLANTGGATAGGTVCVSQIG